MKTISKIRNKQIKNVTDNKVYINGDIAPYDWAWGTDVYLDKVKEQIDNISADSIEVHINSCGGDVFEGIAIYHLLKDCGKKVNVVIDALAASIASVIAMAGETITMGKGTQMMIHNPATFAFGDVKDFEKVIESLRSCKDAIMEVYTDHAIDGVDYAALMDNETWMTSAKAAEIFSDIIIDNNSNGSEMPTTNRNQTIINHFKNSIQ